MRPKTDFETQFFSGRPATAFGDASEYTPRVGRGRGGPRSGPTEALTRRNALQKDARTVVIIE